MSIRFDGWAGHEAYLIFHLTKEEKRNGVRSPEWEREVSAGVVSAIRDAQTFEAVEGALRTLLEERRKGIDLAGHAARLGGLPPQARDDYEIQFLAVGPSGFQHLFTGTRREILVNVGEPDLARAAAAHIYRREFWEPRAPDYHLLFHVFFYNRWRESYGVEADPRNFDSQLLAGYEECEQRLKGSL